MLHKVLSHRIIHTIVTTQQLTTVEEEETLIKVMKEGDSQHVNKLSYSMPFLYNDLLCPVH